MAPKWGKTSWKIQLSKRGGFEDTTVIAWDNSERSVVSMKYMRSGGSLILHDRPSFTPAAPLNSLLHPSTRPPLTLPLPYPLPPTFLLSDLSVKGKRFHNISAAYSKERTTNFNTHTLHSTKLFITWAYNNLYVNRKTQFLLLILYYAGNTSAVYI